MLKTLGGDRLGSGKKMKVELHGYERSTHDLGYLWRSTMSAGTLVPFMCEVALPGDTFDIDLDAVIKTHPTIGPLFGSYKVQIDTFLAPFRLYHSALHNNKLGIGLKMSDVQLPVIGLTAKDLVAGTDDIDNSQINPSSLLAYLGIRGIGNTKGTGNHLRFFNAIPVLAYWEIYKNYYANKSEEIGAVIHTPAETVDDNIQEWRIYDFGNTEYILPGAPATNSINPADGWRMQIEVGTGTGPLKQDTVIVNTDIGQLLLSSLLQSPLIESPTDTWLGHFNAAVNGLTIYSYQYASNSTPRQLPPKVVTFPLTNIDEVREAILATAPLSGYNLSNYGSAPYTYLHTSNADGVPNILSSQEGLALKTYQSDMLNNWLSTDWLDGTGGINEITAIDTTGDSFEVNALILAKKVFDMLNRIAVSGGSYNDWIEAAYGTETYMRAESPVYLGGLSKELVFQEVVSNSESTDQPLGTLAGKGVMSGKHKGGKINVRVDEPSYIIGLISLTPRIDNSQGNKWDTQLRTMDDLHKPGLDGIGFQESINEDRAWWTTYWDGTKWVQTSAGKVPAWLHYMTNVNQVRGNFAIGEPVGEMFMTLNRRYESDETNSEEIKDLTTYIDPSKYNNIFAETAIDAQNFWAQIAVQITARRKMSAKVMPNL